MLPFCIIIEKKICFLSASDMQMSSLKIELCAMQKGSMMKHKRCIGFIKKYKGGIGNIQISIKRSIVEVYCLFVIKCINYAYKMHRLCVQNA